jgi:ABC-2 type transport system ATP-binding protein
MVETATLSTTDNTPVQHTTQAPLVSLAEVSKRYGKLQVLDGLNLNVRPGEIYGFLGRNGAGKSTAIRLMMGISPPSSGTVSVFGSPMRGSRCAKARQRIGFVAQEQSFYPWMTPDRLGKFMKGLYPDWSNERYQSLLSRFELPLNRKSGSFSGGMKSRLALSMALAAMPKLLILDEPTAGMDPVARREFLSLVKAEVTHSDTTVFFSTHLIGDIESLADRIGILDQGTLVYEGSLDALSKRTASFSADVTPETDAFPLDELNGYPFDIVQAGGDTRKQTVILRWLSDEQPNIPPSALPNGWQPVELSLEDIFVAMILQKH